MSIPLASVADLESAAFAVTGPAQACRRAAWLLFFAAAAIPVSLLWDFSWESTIGVELFWAPPHAATYLAVALAATGAVVLAVCMTRPGLKHDQGLSVAGLRAPLGAWMVLWGALAFATAVLFGRWWQGSYGLAAGIWHPPQLLKAAACFAITIGAWLLSISMHNNTTALGRICSPVAGAIAGGAVMALISTVTLTWNYANRQHSAPFYIIACSLYPALLTAVATAGSGRWPTSAASLVYTAIICTMIWLLPLFPAEPQGGPIYNVIDRMLPPPFPLLLVVPAAAIDWLSGRLRIQFWLRAVTLGAVFFVLFAGAQWIFAEFLLSDLAENRFFAGGGKHWPFFLKIDSLSRVSFWDIPGEVFNLRRAAIVACIAMLSASIGLWVGSWMKRLQR